MHRRIFYAGMAVLIAGLVAAALIYAFAAENTGVDPAADIISNRAYERRIELFGGKAAVYMVRFNRWLESLWQGTQLAYTVGVLSIAIALGCFWVARLVAEPTQDTHDE